MRYLVQVDVTDFIEVEAESASDACASARDIFNLQTADYVSVRVVALKVRPSESAGVHAES